MRKVNNKKPNRVELRKQSKAYRYLNSSAIKPPLAPAPVPFSVTPVWLYGAHHNQLTDTCTRIFPSEHLRHQTRRQRQHQPLSTLTAFSMIGPEHRKSRFVPLGPSPVAEYEQQHQKDKKGHQRVWSAFRGAELKLYAFEVPRVTKPIVFYM
ncbi:hypothetical protein ES702_03679 [subsurface metagenome]